MSVIKRVFIILLVTVILTVLALGVYVIFLNGNYYRIKDKQVLDVEESLDRWVKIGEEYTALTYNIGFGAYNREYSFFMDSGKMKDGRKTKGKYAKARSKRIAEENTRGVIDVTKSKNTDFNLFQEVDQRSDRSHQVNQEEEIKTKLGELYDINSSFASNFHSVFLAYPFNDPIGSIESGLLTTGKYRIEESVRRSFPVTDSFINKFFDLDRCFVVNRIPVEGGTIGDKPHLVLINVHMSAYDKGGIIRKQQMKVLAEVLKEEMERGNWVVVGGDFNHALYGTEKTFDSDQHIPDWVQPFDEGSLPQGMEVVKAGNINDVATVRATDIPYEEGVNYLTVIDGFIVSHNVEAAAENINEGFRYSDHDPVLLKFKLRH